MKNVHIFIRKKANKGHHSVERFALTLKKFPKSIKLNIKIKRCPVTSRGILRRIYLIVWSYFNQGDVNHILGDINYISILMKKKKTINTFLDCRLLDQFHGIKNFFYKFLWFKLPIKKSRITTYISNFTKSQIEKKLRKKIKNAKVVPVPLMDNLEFKINNNKNKKILIVGTSKHKNLENMIIALNNLKVNLTIIGELDHKIRNLCKANKIFYKNFVNIKDNKLKTIFAKNDILLMVSNYEGFGMPIIEAQASGLVVITSNIEPMKSIIGRNGLTVNNKKPYEIKKKLKRLLKDKKYFLKSLNDGKQNSKKYSSKIVNNYYYNLYKKILNYEY